MNPALEVLGLMIGTLLLVTVITYFVMPGVWQPLMTAANAANVALGTTTPAGMIQTPAAALALMAPIGIAFIMGAGMIIINEFQKTQAQKRRKEEMWEPEQVGYE